MADKIIIEDAHREYEHGEIRSTRVDSCESQLEADVRLTISTSEYVNFKSELEELVKKYAL